jgi:hypothetical protein
MNMKFVCRKEYLKIFLILFAHALALFLLTGCSSIPDLRGESWSERQYFGASQSRQRPNPVRHQENWYTSFDGSVNYRHDQGTINSVPSWPDKVGGQYVYSNTSVSVGEPTRYPVSVSTAPGQVQAKTIYWPAQGGGQSGGIYATRK